MTQAVREKSHKRLDIQGLRALAVLVVIANHIWEWPSGGFVGVDVFFVLSGFLISDLLVGERRNNGRISFAKFYRRRIRRIVPAATFVILVTVVGAAALFGQARARTVAIDGIWAFLFAGNWNMAREGTDYFNNDLVSPLQHYWSLSVEEQFYFVWPGVILLAFALAKGHRRPDMWLATVMAALSAASLAYSIWHTQSQPTWAYFSTFDRAWELGVGALLALAKPLLARLPGVLAGAAGWTGLAGICCSLWIVPSDSGFPAPWALLPVASTALVVAAGVGHAQRHLFPLVNPIAKYLGDISYSLYLWHFPAVVLLLAIWPNRGVTYSAVVLVSTFTLSALSYRLIEEPIRHSNWLEPGRRRGSQSFSARPGLKYEWLGVLFVVVIGMWVVTFRTVNTQAPAVADIPDLIAVAPGDATEGDAGEQTLSDLQTIRVQGSLALSDFPKLRPDPSELSSVTWSERLAQDACVDVTRENLGSCVYGPDDSQRTAVLFGDSFAMAWLPGVKKALTSDGWRVQQLTFQQCPPWNISVEKFGGEAYPECDEWRKWAIEKIAELKPSLVVISASHETVRRLQGVPRDGASVYQGLKDVISQITTGRSVVLSPPPTTGNLKLCATNFSKPSDCEQSITEEWHVVDMAQARAAEETGAQYVNTRAWFCSNDRCPAFIGSEPVSVDGLHLTWEFSEGIAPLLEEALSAGGSPSGSASTG